MSDSDQDDKCKQPFQWDISVCTSRMQWNTSLWLPSLFLSQRLCWRPRSGLSLGIESPQSKKGWGDKRENREHCLRTGRSIGKEEKDEVWRGRMESRGGEGHWWEGREIGRAELRVKWKKERCRRIITKPWEQRTKKGREESRDWSMKWVRKEILEALGQTHIPVHL